DGIMRGKVGRLLSHLAAWRAKHIIVVSEGLANRVRRWRKPLSVIPSGINLERFYPMSKSKCRDEIGWSPTVKVVLFNRGSDAFLKGEDLVLESMEELRSCGEVCQLFVLDGNVPHDKLPLYINAADCVVLASRHEGSPNIVKEAMACEVPVVSVDVGDVRERLSESTRSCLVESRDSALFAEAILRILREERRGSDRALISSLELGQVSRRVVSVYESVARRMWENGEEEA
ncbi:MAG: glycosyltransferase family 4 protein, partial [Bdellovibrionales bacterium]|nr:glycosyltransferase family 4 protein [Bdellovibrionales bacterium]